MFAALSILNAWAQGQTGPTPSAPDEHSAQIGVKGESAHSNEPSSTGIAASDPVITIHGLCQNQEQALHPAAATDSCTTVVTRESFERLLDSMNITGKPLTPETRKNLAEIYAQYLALERRATQAGLEDTQRFGEIMRWWRLRTLAGLYRGNLQEQFKSPSPEEVHAYYIQHLASYQRITAARILIPRTPGPTDEAKRSDQKALQVANSARERVAQGEDPEVIQKDAYSSLAMSSPPRTNLGTLARSGFPPEETDELFALESGQASKVETEGASYVIYKIASKEVLSEDSVKDEISRQIAQSKFSTAVQSLNESAKPEFNQGYFGPPRASPSVDAGSWANPHP
jgi:hypothetical protein